MTRASEPPQLARLTQVGQIAHAERIERALRAVRRVAEEQRLSFDQAVVLRDLSNLVVHLRGTNVVARVATVTAEMRPGAAWLTREVAMARHLSAAGAPVVRPSPDIPPGPHQSDGLVLSFWEKVEELEQPADARAAGHALRECHEALADFPGELPRWGAFHEGLKVLARLEAECALPAADLATLRRVADRLAPQLESLELPLQAVHGDAGPSNALNTTRGVVWTDWEDCFLGPTAWDLACLVSSARILQANPAGSELALQSYGPRCDDDPLDLCIAARAFYVTLWVVVIGAHHGSAVAGLESRLQWLRERFAP